MQAWASPKKQSGFTLVEILTIVVVIAILVIVTTMAYNGAQSRARDSTRETSADTIQSALESYFSANGDYPNACGSTGTPCNVAQLSDFLVPKYTGTVPNDPHEATPMEYVLADTETGYGIKVRYENKPECKYLGGTSANDTNNAWWGSSVPKC